MKKAFFSFLVLLCLLLSSCTATSNDITPTTEEIVNTAIVESDFAIFNIQLSALKLNSTNQIITVDVEISAKVIIEQRLPTSSYGSEGLIQIRIVSVSDNTISLFNEYYGADVDTMILDVHLNVDDIISRRIRFARAPLYQGYSELPSPIGLYSVQVATYAPEIVWIDTGLQVSVQDSISNSTETNSHIFDYKEDNLETDIYESYYIKMSPDLLLTIDDLSDDELVSVYVFLEQINYDIVKTRLLTHGIDESIYRDEELFLDFIHQLYGHDIELVTAERERYRTLRLQVIKQITLEVNRDFIDLFDIDVNQIIYSSSYTTTLIIRVTRSTLKLIASDDSVVNLSLYTEPIPEVSDTIWTE